MKYYRAICLSTLFPAALATAAEKSTISLSIDNDGIFGVDKHYTSGLFLSYTSGEVSPYPIFSLLSLSSWSYDPLDKIEFLVGHKMYTPSEIKQQKPAKNDRPYAGFFHTEFNYLSLASHQAHRFNFTLGTTGKRSMAEDAQNIVHGITGSDEPRGWAYQIDNKTIVNIGYRLHSELFQQRSLANTDLELSNISEVNLGNFRSDLSTGVMLRWGTDLNANIGSANINTERPFEAGMIADSQYGWYLFTGIKVRYRANDMTIEGERSEVKTYTQTNGLNSDYFDVHLKQVQTSAVAGFAWYNEHFGASLTLATKSPDYKEASSSIYSNGSLSLFAFF